MRTYFRVFNRAKRAWRWTICGRILSKSPWEKVFWWVSSKQIPVLSSLSSTGHRLYWHVLDLPVLELKRNVWQNSHVSVTFSHGNPRDKPQWRKSQKSESSCHNGKWHCTRMDIRMYMYTAVCTRVGKRLLVQLYHPDWVNLGVKVQRCPNKESR